MCNRGPVCVGTLDHRPRSGSAGRKQRGGGGGVCGVCVVVVVVVLFAYLSRPLTVNGCS